MLLESDKTIARLLVDPAVSHWLKEALWTAARRDPVDALNDAEVLCQVLTERVQEILTRKELGGDLKEG